MVHVTKSNFLTQLSDFLHHLPTSSYIAIDEEMTGISIPDGDDRDQRPNKVELPGERYASRLKGVPERYSILQVGVALFHKNANYRRPSSSYEDVVVAVEAEDGEDEAVVATVRGGLVGGPGLGMEINNSDNDNDDGGNNNEEDEHAFMHREGTLNQDELEDVTEREEEEGGGTMQQAPTTTMTTPISRRRKGRWRCRRNTRRGYTISTSSRTAVGRRGRGDER
jgi:poly(A)-specific ribonuclease